MDVGTATAEELKATLKIGLDLHLKGNFTEAAAHYLGVLEKEKDNYDALALLGTLENQRGNYASSIDILKRALSINGTNPVTHNNLGESYRLSRQYAKALESYEKALELKPDYHVLHNNIGICLTELGRKADAIESFKKAVAAIPDFTHAHYNLGSNLASLGKYAEALEPLKKAAELDPGLGQAHGALGWALLELNRNAEAEQSLRKALELNITGFDTYFRLGLACHKQNKYGPAETAFLKALEIKPSSMSALDCLGTLYYVTGRREAAEKYFKAAYAVNPYPLESFMKYSMTCLPFQCSDLEDSENAAREFSKRLDELKREIKKHPLGKVAAAVGTIQPGNLGYRPGNHKKVLSKYGDLICSVMSRWAAETGIPQPSRPAPGKSKIKMVIVTGQIRRHSVWDVLLHGLLEHIDRERFEIILYHTSTIKDDVTRWAKENFQFVEPPADLLKKMLEDRPDVIFYPEIGMDNATLRLASMRLAPLQAVYWGHPITSGLPTIDIFFSGELIERKAARSDYCEELVKLPGSGTCSVLMPFTARKPAIALPEDRSITRFVSCQQAIKYDPAYDDVYARIALEAGPCLFWFSRDPNRTWAFDEAMSRIRKTFVQLGLDPDSYIRIIGWLPGDQFWGLMDEMDVFLDHPSFSGYTTAWQASRRGLPIITLEGPQMRQRLAAGYLRRIGITETIAGDVGQYIRKAVELARSPDRRASLREKIREASPLAENDVTVVKAIEAALITRLEKMSLEGDVKEP